MFISLVAAIGENNALGKDGNLLWHLPEDMKRFKQITVGHHVLMGRKTYESIPEKYRPLSDRTNIVISASGKHFEGVYNITDILQGIAFAGNNRETELMVIGGGKVYDQTIKLADRLYLTIVHHVFDADTFFPQFEMSEWRELKKEFIPANEKNAFDMTFLDLERIKKS